MTNKIFIVRVESKLDFEFPGFIEWEKVMPLVRLSNRRRTRIFFIINFYFDLLFQSCFGGKRMSFG